MNGIYLSQLPHKIRSLVDEIEQYVGYEISVKIDESREDILACEVDEQGIVILIPNEGYFPDGAVLHELLHIRRFCLDKVPRIVLCENFKHWTPTLETSITKLDNNLEHFVIIPQELNLIPKRINHWKSRMNKNLENCRSSNDIKDDQERRALIYWILTKHVLLENELTQKASMLIESLGIEDRASKFLDEIIPYIDVKDKLVKVCLEHLRLPDDLVCLEYIDCKNKRRLEKPL